MAMLELIACSLLTILPDFLIRRFVQGKRIGREITFFSVWYELRWGITLCVMLTVLLITVIFYFHPSTSNATMYFRTVPILPETGGRVSEIYVGVNDKVKAGQPLFKLDTTLREAEVETSRRQIAEVEAAMTVARADIAAAEGQLEQARSALKQVMDELRVKRELAERKSGTVAPREIERLETAVAAAEGQVSAASAARDAARARAEVQLPAQKASAEARLAETQIELNRATILAGFDGQLQQFILQVGDMVNPMMRPAGILIPAGSGRRRLVAGFNQIEAQVMKPGMVAEAACISDPLTIIPLVVTTVQEHIAAGQVRVSEQLVDAQQVARPGSLLVMLEPLYEGGLDGVAPGGSCIVNAYSSHHEAIASGEVGGLTAFALHGVDAVALVHAMLLRVQSLLMPVTTLVLSGH
jgi:multidrug resistance efflux pump